MPKFLRICVPILVAALLPRPALPQDRAAALRARLAREKSPVQKAKLMPRLGDAEFLQIEGDVAAGRIPEALRGLEQYRDQALELSKELDATGINAEKKPAGFKQLEISLRDSLRRMDSFMGSLTAAFSVIRCKKRTEVLKGGAYLLVVNIITALFIMLYEGRLTPLRTGYAIMFASISAAAVIATVSIVLPLFEYLFGIMTDISLLELLDLEHPLMKTMMITAPGTYHHSIIVGNLVEAAAEDVAVNPLLARVSAYYHDIGKVKMPDYFIENQSSGASRHERLTPHMSSMVLISHVKEGVDLAKQYKLPETVTDIIEQHHGTSLITYFYQKAKEKNEELPEDEYRYPGPRPQSKVAALVMMADAVEAASRVLADPIPARISGLVNKIINHIFLEGQLDQCDLTLKEIQAIKKRFTYILTGILHKRVDYPGFDFTKEGAGAGTNLQPAKKDSLKYPADKEGQPQPASAFRAHRN